MARNEITVDAPAETVYAVLADPRRYADFVVGSRRVRRFDPRWPEPGTAIHHSLGFEPLVLRDSTVSLEDDPPRRLVVEARMRPLAITPTAFDLAPDGAGTRVVAEEHPTSGLLSWAWNPALDGVLRLRNAVMLRRLKRLAEDRERWRRRAAAHSQ